MQVLKEWGLDVWQPEEDIDDVIESEEVAEIDCFYEVTITCKNELEQKDTYHKLKNDGYNCNDI